MWADVLDREAAQDDAAWRKRMEAAVSLDDELDAEEVLVDCIVWLFTEVCAPAVVAVKPAETTEATQRCTTCLSPDPERQPKPGHATCLVCLGAKAERAEVLHRAGKCAYCHGSKEPHLRGERCRKCLDALTVKNRRRQGFKGKVYRCTICRGAGHNAQTCARREAA